MIERAIAMLEDQQSKVQARSPRKAAPVRGGEGYHPRFSGARL